MGKVVKGIIMVVVAVAIIVYAAPFIGAVAGLYGASAAVIGAITSAVVGIGLSLGLSGATSIFRKAPNLNRAMVDRLSASVNPTATRKIVFGRTAAGADVRFQETWGRKEDQFARVIALASHRVNRVTHFYTDEELTWYQGTLVQHRQGITSFRAVTEGSSANAAPLGSGSYWTSSSKFTGCAYLALNFKLDSKEWPQGIPQKISTIVEGCPVYDPRIDTSRGGSGSHRADNQNTWQWLYNTTEIGRNPALCLLTYLIGWKINGKLCWGMGVPISRINLENFKVYANICEERVQMLGGGTTQRYTCDGIFSTSDSHDAIISAITSAMGSCKMSDVGGQYSLIGGYDDTFGPKQPFTADDLIAGPGGVSPYLWTPAGPTRETYNIVTGQFADPDEQFQLASWGTIETDALPDGVPRSLTLDLGCVNRAETCQRIAKQFLLREAKTPGFFSGTFGPRAFAVQVGSLCTLSLPSEGWNNKLFRVEEQKEVADCIFQMRLREESSEVYAWDREEKPLPVTIRPPGYDASMTISPENVTLETVTYQSVS